MIITKNPALAGMNVTIPYKLEVMKFLDDLSEDAEEIDAVNVIKFENLIFKNSQNDRPEIMARK